MFGDNVDSESPPLKVMDEGMYNSRIRASGQKNGMNGSEFGKTTGI